MRNIFIATLFAIILPALCLADGIPITNGRYAGGPSIVIVLTSQQRELIEAKYEPFFDLPLNDEQREVIRKQASVNPPPSKLMLVRISDIAGECTCGAANLGLLIDPSRAGIPVKYICTDEAAEKKKIE